MIPTFEEFLYPFLFALKDKNITTKEMRETLIEHFHLSKEDCALTTKGGNLTQLSDRINWARQYFRRAKFIEIPNRGVYQITQRGKDYLKNHSTLSIKDLMEYPEYAEFANKKTANAGEQQGISQKSTEITPTEALEEAYTNIYKSLSEELLTMVIQQSPAFFEKLVVDLLVAMGYGGAFKDAAIVTPYSHDDGIDGIIKEDKLGLDNIYVQAKRWTNPVSKPQIQQFSGALDEQKASKGVFITTSTFTKEAENFVKRASKKIVLIDGYQLTSYMIEFNVGVSVKKEYTVKRIDIDYFEDQD